MFLTRSKYKAETLSHPSKLLLINQLNDRDWREACKLVKNDEMFARIPDNKGNLPIHLAVKLGGTNDLLVLLLNAYPECIQMRDPKGNLPLHLVAYHHQDRLWVSISEITRTLVKWYPEGLEETDAQADTPLLIAIKERSVGELLRCFLKKRPRTAADRDRYGNTPLHLCCQYNSVSYELFEKLVKCWEDAVAAENQSGLIPLHKACHFHAPLEYLQLLLDRHPDGIKAKDRHGNLPIHYLYLSLMGPPDPDKLSLLLKYYPNSLSVSNNKGFVPLSMLSSPQDRYRDEYMTMP